MKRRRFLATGTALATTGLLSGCAGGGGGDGGTDDGNVADGDGSSGNTNGGNGGTTSSGPNTFENEAGVPVGEDFETIQELAKDEDPLTLYSTQDREPVQTWTTEFNKTYPDVGVELVAGGSSDLMSRWDSEYKSDNVQADLFSSLGAGVGQIWKSEQNMTLNPEILPSFGEAPEEFKDTENGDWITLRLHMGSMCFNTDEVSQDSVAAYEDIVNDDRWSGQKIGWDPTPNPYYMTWFLDNFGTEFFEKLAEQRPRFVDSHTDLVRFCGAGEFPVTFTYTFNIAKFGPDYPVDYFREGIDTLPGIKAPILVNNKANNPNSALVFLNWLTSAEGQTVLGTTPYLPWHSDARYTGWTKDNDLYPSDQYEVSFMDPDIDVQRGMDAFNEAMGDLI